MLRHGSRGEYRVHVAQQQDLPGAGAHSAFQQITAGTRMGDDSGACGEEFLPKLLTLGIQGFLAAAGGI
jgi:hypothetical protein